MVLARRKDALEVGDITYNTGKACSRGHFAPRYTKSGVCIECSQDHRKENPTIYNPEKAKVYSSLPENKAKQKEYMRIYLQDPVNKAKNKARRKQHYHDNKVKYKTEALIWSKAHPEVRNRLEGKRRASKLNATPSWLNEQQLEDISFIYKEAIDLKELTGEDYAVDHIIPLQHKKVCGLHVPWNLQVLTVSQNSVKSNKFEGEIIWNGQKTQ